MSTWCPKRFARTLPPWIGWAAKATQRRFGVARGVEKPNDGAATGHQAAPPREGGEPPPANAAGARPAGGIEGGGGGAHPSPDRNVLRGHS